jgi:hypothetical protein
MHTLVRTKVKDNSKIKVMMNVEYLQSEEVFHPGYKLLGTVLVVQKKIYIYQRKISINYFKGPVA